MATVLVVTANAGHLWLESQGGAGSTFRFTLPAAGATVDADPSA